MTQQREPEHCGHQHVCWKRYTRMYINEPNCEAPDCKDDTRRSPIHQQSALQTCDNILEELQDILKEFGESEDYRFVEAVADLHSRVLTWKERPDIKGNRRTPAPQQPLPNDANRCYVCGKPFEEGITVHRDEHGWRHPDTDPRCQFQPVQQPDRYIDESTETPCTPEGITLIRESAEQAAHQPPGADTVLDALI